MSKEKCSKCGKTITSMVGVVLTQSVSDGGKRSCEVYCSQECVPPESPFYIPDVGDKYE